MVLPLFLLLLAGLLPADPPSVEQQERFLRTARITQSEPVGVGVNGTRRAVLSDGSLTHQAHIQTVNRRMPDLYAPDNQPVPLYDSYRFNIAAWHLSRMLGLDMVPVSVEREIEGLKAAVTWWADGVLFDEQHRVRQGRRAPDQAAWNRQLSDATVFDNLIFNTDRNSRNILITSEWKLVLIDHTRAFAAKPLLPQPQRLSRISEELLAGLRRLKASGLDTELSRWLTASERRALLARRDLLLQFFDGQIRERGKREVVYQRSVTAPQR